jgi:PAS domain S-box-containing protein
MPRIENNSESDIIRHEEIKLRLKESEMNFRTIADQSLMGIAIIQDNLLKYVNQKLADLLEYSVEEMINWGPKEFYKVIGPETIELAKEQSSIKQMGLPGAIENLITQLKKKSGKLFYADNFSKKVIYQGRTANFVTLIDVTRRLEAEQKLKESEEKFRILFSNATSGIAYHTIVYDAKGTPIDYIIKDVNPQYERILSLKREDVINEKATELYKVDNAPYLNIYSKVAKTKESTTFETYFPPMNRDFRISVLSPKKGEFITIFDDISEQKKADRKLKVSEINYRKAYELVNLYKDLLTHDVNNIITLIQGTTQMYSLYKSNPDKINELIETISESSNKAKKLVANVCILSQVEEDVDVLLKSVDVLNYLNDAIKFTCESFKGREVHITVDSPSKNIIAHANDLLINMFENILNNGVKYNNNLKVEITIKISKEQKGNRNFIKIEFIDNGIGISDEFKEIIFQRGHENTKGGKGLGFGLSVVKKVIELYNGKIWVENRVKDDYSKGTKFIVLLPRKK